MIRTLILTEKEGWHFQQLKTSLEKREHKVFSGCLSNISLSLSNNKANLFINDALIPEIDNVIVRFVPGGTLEEITYYLNILKIFDQYRWRGGAKHIFSGLNTSKTHNV